MKYWTDGRAWLWALVWIVEITLCMLPATLGFIAPVSILSMLFGTAWISTVGAAYLT